MPPMNGVRSAANAPVWWIAKLTLTPPSARGDTPCAPTVVMPALVAAQMKECSGSNSVTFQTMERRRGCSTRAVLPTPNGPASRRCTRFIDCVHSGQRSTSMSVSQTAVDGAWMSIVTSWFISIGLPDVP
jgi:hypothetical protein